MNATSEHGATARSALVTGASRGIGLGIARRLASQGWSLTLAARDAAALRKTQIALCDLGAGRVETFAGDMADPDVAGFLVDRHERAFGSIDALILAAGVGSAGPIEGYPMSRFDKQIAVNLRAPFALVSKAMPMLRAGAATNTDGASRVVVLASIEAEYPEPGLAAYGASKAALISMVRSINAEEAASGVLATAISPAYVDTDMSSWVRERIPADTMISVEDVIRVVEMVLDLSRNAALPHLVINRVGAGAYSA
jgi:3-oxoacyl-[acyl-carrier protein] reductase